MSRQELDGALIEVLRDALVRSFDTDELVQLVTFAWSVDLDTLAAPTLAHNTRVFRLLRHALGSGRLRALLRTARRLRLPDTALADTFAPALTALGCDLLHEDIALAVDCFYRLPSYRAGLTVTIGLDLLLDGATPETLVDAAAEARKLALLVETMHNEHPDEPVLRALKAALDERDGGATAETLTAWLSWLVRHHQHLLHFHRLAPKDLPLEDVFVRVQVAGRHADERGFSEYGLSEHGLDGCPEPFDLPRRGLPGGGVGDRGHVDTAPARAVAV